MIVRILQLREPSIASGVLSGGVTYTRWGHNACPSVSGTEMLYTGRMAGVLHNQRGGGANFLCLPNDPEYNTLNTYSPSDYSKIYGTEYQYPIAGSLDHNVPCAVCYATTRAAKVMIPARTSCPPSWTREYYGYLYRVKIKFTIVNGLCRQRLSISVWITCRHQWNCNIM